MTTVRCVRFGPKIDALTVVVVVIVMMMDGSNDAVMMSLPPFPPPSKNHGHPGLTTSVRE